jgi:transcriptional regulator GlxA family with amidase domain
MQRRADPMESRSFLRLIAMQDTIAALLSLLNIAQCCDMIERALSSAFVITLQTL